MPGLMVALVRTTSGGEERRLKILGAIFDLDGTLLDSAPTIMAALHAAFEDVGLPVPEGLNQTWIGPPVAEILANRVPSLTELERQSIVRAFRHRYDSEPIRGTTPFPGIVSALEELGKLGIRVFVATNKPLGPTKELTDTWFPGLIEHCICVDSLPGRKLSKSEMIEVLLSRFHLAPNETVVIGDGVTDIEGAIQNGCQSIAVSWGYTPVGELLFDERTLLARSTGELRSLGENR